LNLWVFVIAFSVMFAGFNLYIKKRFFDKLFVTHQKASSIFMLILYGLTLLYVIDRTTAFLPRWSIIHFIISLSIGITTMLLFVTLFYDITHTSAKRIPYREDRRRFLKIIFDSTIVILAFSYIFRGFKGGLTRPKLNSVEVKIKNFIGEVNIMQLSDVHVGKTIGRDDILDMVKRVNAQKPDIVVLTGDIIDDDIELLIDDLEPFAHLEAPAYYILGNHEYFHGADKAIAHMKSLGMHVLLNDSVTIDNRYNLVGLKDLMGSRIRVHEIDVVKAYEKVNRSLPTIVLAHQPKTTRYMGHFPYDLMLSGHTHGGQIFPLSLLVKLDQPYVAGLYQHTPRQQLFVSRGSGYWGPPIRFLAPAEITKLTIKAS
jgi:uncharacterized protein